MADNVNETPNAQENAVELTQAQTTATVVEEVKAEPAKIETKQNPAKVNKDKTQEKKKIKKDKKPSKIATSLKETRSELKKVT